ncbi:cytochrome D1 domain-containing protein [Ideonella dechloratans]|uniref:cytochrome D1 domain-containing protein n=1 Tax=Ideonella dechloratans TaxID=36863 RepID=UPI0035B2040F
MNLPPSSPTRRGLGLSAGAALAGLWLGGCAQVPGAADAAVASPGFEPVLRGTGDLGLVILRASGAVALVDTSQRSVLARVDGLGDLSHASAVFSRDMRYAYVFGRDGGLSKIDLLTARVVRRVMQAGNSIGGAISADGRLVAAQNYQPGGVKVFDADTLALRADIPATFTAADGTQRTSRVVGLADLPGQRFAFSLFDADALWVADCSALPAVRLQKFEGIGRSPYDGLVTPDGRHYIAGLFGEDGLALLDLWAPQPQVRRILAGYGRGQEPLPVYKMPHLRGWAVAGRKAYLPAIGRHEVLVVDTTTWQELGRIPVAGQPVFVIARPDGRQVWVNFAVPDYHRVQVFDTVDDHLVTTLEPGKAVLHMEFTPRGEQVWISSRDDDRVSIYDTRTLALLQRLTLPAPSGIFFTARAQRLGF